MARHRRFSFNSLPKKSSVRAGYYAPMESRPAASISCSPQWPHFCCHLLILLGPVVVGHFYPPKLRRMPRLRRIRPGLVLPLGLHSLSFCASANLSGVVLMLQADQGKVAHGPGPCRCSKGYRGRVCLWLRKAFRWALRSLTRKSPGSEKCWPAEPEPSPRRFEPSFAKASRGRAYHPPINRSGACLRGFEVMRPHPTEHVPPP